MSEYPFIDLRHRNESYEPNVAYATTMLFEYVRNGYAAGRGVPYDTSVLLWRLPTGGWQNDVKTITNEQLLAAGIPCSIAIVPPKLAGIRYPTYLDLLVTATQLSVLM
jgi:hypothetical protein